MGDCAGLERRRLIARGVAWNSLYQIFQAALTLGVMLVLVRVIPPAEYGRAGAVLGFLTLLNTFNCANFMTHALQLPDGAEPNWSLHWSAAFYIQIALTGTCHLLAGFCWLFTAYRPIAPLLHLASLGLLIDSANRLGYTMLQHAVDFQRLRLVHGLGTLASVAVTLVLGLAGSGAYAIVLGSNVMTALPFTIDLLVVRRWRPQPDWWRWPDWIAYRPALRFGLQQIGAGLLRTARGTLEAAVLPAVLGFAAMGLLNRGQALFSTTIGRVGRVLVETVYPILPRYAADPRLYPSQATLFAQIIFLIVVPGALYLGLEGPALSRLLYGDKWIAADPLLWPGALTGMGLAVFTVSVTILLAINRLRACFILHLSAAALGTPMVIIAWAGGGLIAYAWAVAVGQVLSGAIALTTASPHFVPSWVRVVLIPPIVSSIFAVGGAMIADRLSLESPLMIRLFLSAFMYGLVMVIVLRGLFPMACSAVLSRVPGGSRVQDWARLLTQPVGLR